MNNMKLGTKYGSVSLVDFQSEWVEYFIVEKNSIKNQFSDKVVWIEHIGSTSIPSIKSKPTIDILVGFLRLSDVNYYIDRLAKTGYEYRSNHPVDGRFHFSKIKNGVRYFNISIVQYKGTFWNEKVYFRDILKADKDKAKEYEKSKEKAYKLYPENTTQYTSCKSEFINRILDGMYKSK